MSKNAAKKLARKQKMEATKHERRAAERLKKKENKRARYLAAQSIELNTQANPTSEAESSTVKRKVSTSSVDVEADKRGEKEEGR